jgi:hypothetical protein
MTRLILISLAVLVGVLAACAPPPELRNESLLNDRSLVTGEPCGPPCFRGIVPGETEWQDALTILEDDPEFTNIQTQSGEDTDIVQAAWQQGDNQTCCQMASQDGETVSLLLLLTAPVMMLEEVIDVHGEPEYLVASEPFTPEQAVMNLVYPDTPMLVYAFVAGEETGELMPDSEIIGMLYFTPEEMEIFLQTNTLQAWEGYQTYQYYQESEFEITPAITVTPNG